MSGLTPEVFRRRLVEFVAFESPFGRRWVTRGRNEELAKAIGVDPSILDEAGAMLRAGALPKDGQGSIVHVEMSVPSPVARPINELAESVGMSPSQLVRAMLHVMMQTTREPSMRAPRRWHNGKGARVHGFGFRGKRINTDGRSHFEFVLSRGLSVAISKRANAYGATRNRYVILWMADLADGLLADHVFPPISTGQMFFNDYEYVLPVIEPPERATLADHKSDEHSG